MSMIDCHSAGPRPRGREYAVEIFSWSTLIQVRSLTRPPGNHPPFKQPARLAFHLCECSLSLSILRFFVPDCSPENASRLWRYWIIFIRYQAIIRRVKKKIKNGDDTDCRTITIISRGYTRKKNSCNIWVPEKYCCIGYILLQEQIFLL